MKRKIEGVIRLDQAPIQVELDSEAHAAYVRFSRNKVARTDVVSDDGCNVTIDRDAKGKVIGVELIGVKNFNIGTLLKKAHLRVNRAAMGRTQYVPAPAKELVAA